MKRRGCKVTACDVLSFPNAFQHVRVVCQRRPGFAAVKRHLGVESNEAIAEALNHSERRSQWFEREYSEKRMFFTRENAKKIGAAWSLIGQWQKGGLLSDSERKYFIASLLNSLDCRANTAGTYYAYLKKYHRKALKPFRFEWMDITRGKYAGVALQGDAFECLMGKTFDLLYLDPPYNERDYSRYYHLPESLYGLKHTSIDPSSRAGQPVRRSQTGVAIRQSMGLPYIRKLVETVNWKRLVVQYAEGAHIQIPEISRALSEYGDLKAHCVDALCYTSTQNGRKQLHHVFIVDR